MKKALIVTTVSGFVPQFEMNNVRLLQELGYEVHYASNFSVPMYPIDEEKLKREGIILHHIPIQKEPVRFWKNLRAVRSLKKLIREEGISLVHCHNPMGSVAARLAADAVSPAPYVIYTTHGLHYYKGAPKQNRIYDAVEQRMAHKTDMIITINHEDYEHVGSYTLREGGRTALIPGVGVDEERFRPRPELREAMRRELDIPEGAFHLVTAAELNENKNHQAVIQALSIRHLLDELGRLENPSQYVPPRRIIYSICGSKAVSRSTYTMLKRMVRKYELADDVRFLCLRGVLERVLHSADCFVFPSIREGLGLAAIEALACGMPVIAADNRGSREYLQPGVNGLRCRADVPESFYGAIEKFSENEELRSSCAAAARKSAEPFAKERTESVMRELYAQADEEAQRRFS